MGRGGDGVGVYGTTPIPKQTDVPVLADSGCRSRDLSNLDRIFPPPVRSQLEFVGLRCHSDRGPLFTAVWKSSQRPGFLALPYRRPCRWSQETGLDHLCCRISRSEY